MPSVRGPALSELLDVGRVFDLAAEFRPGGPAAEVILVLGNEEGRQKGARLDLAFQWSFGTGCHPRGVDELPAHG